MLHKAVSCLTPLMQYVSHGAFVPSPDWITLPITLATKARAPHGLTAFGQWHQLSGINDNWGIWSIKPGENMQSVCFLPNLCQMHRGPPLMVTQFFLYFGPALWPFLSLRLVDSWVNCSDRYAMHPRPNSLPPPPPGLSVGLCSYKQSSLWWC